MVNDCEKQALDDFHAILKIMRAGRAVFAEVEEASRRILSLTDETPYRKFLAAMTQGTLEGMQREPRNMESFLIRLSKYSECDNRYRRGSANVKDPVSHLKVESLASQQVHRGAPSTLEGGSHMTCESVCLSAASDA